MTKFEELAKDETTYLLGKWSTEMSELTDESVRAMDRLETRITKQENDLLELNKLKTELQDAKEVSQYLESTGATQEMIDKHKLSISELEREILVKGASNRVLTKKDIAREELEIEELQVRAQLRQNRITQLEALNNAA